MPSVNRQWSQERLGQEDYPVNVVGFSPFQRWAGPLVAKPGDASLSRRGGLWNFVKAGAASAMPASTAAVATFTTSGGVITALGAIVSGGAGYRLGEKVPVEGIAPITGFGGAIKVTGVDAAGSITSAVIYQVDIGPNTPGPQAVGSAYPPSGNFNLAEPAAPFTLVDITNAFEGLTNAAGAAYKSYAPFAQGEFGWIEQV
jgi:hypothetical protein